MVMADEIYGRDLFEGEHVSIASLPGMPERTIVLDGFSKAFAMTGWRLGYAILPPSLVEPFSKLIINSVSCTSSFEQIAAVEALNGPQESVDAHGRGVPRAAPTWSWTGSTRSPASAAACRTAPSTCSPTCRARA